MGQGPAHEQVHPEPGHLHGSLKRVTADQRPAFTPDLTVAIDVDDIQVVGHIEDRGDAISPMGARDPHGSDSAKAMPVF